MPSTASLPPTIPSPNLLSIYDYRACIGFFCQESGQITVESLQRYSRKVREGSLSSTMMDLQPSSLTQTTNLAECAVCHQVFSERYESCVQNGKSSYIVVDIEKYWKSVFAADPKRAGALWRRLLLLLSGLFQVRAKFFSNEKILGKSLRSANCNNHLKSKAESPSLISSCNNRFQLEMYFFLWLQSPNCK